MKCIICGKPTERGWHHGGQWGPYKKSCSEQCRKIREQQITELRKIGWEKNKTRILSEASKRMLDPNNKAHSKEAKEKMIATLKRLGHRPKVRGGNGKEMPVPQRTLLAALGSGWYGEHIVITKSSSVPKNEYPHCYKIDIANPKKMIAIEVDGSSHTALLAQKRDAKKSKFLESKGWRVVRVLNKDVLNNLEKILNEII